MKKKLLSLMLMAVMVVSFGTVALAAPENPNLTEQQVAENLVKMESFANEINESNTIGLTYHYTGDGTENVEEVQSIISQLFAEQEQLAAQNASRLRSIELPCINIDTKTKATIYTQNKNASNAAFVNCVMNYTKNGTKKNVVSAGAAGKQYVGATYYQFTAKTYSTANNNTANPKLTYTGKMTVTPGAIDDFKVYCTF